LSEATEAPTTPREDVIFIVRAILNEIITNGIVYEKEISLNECSYLEDRSYMREVSLVSTSTPV